MFAPEGYLSVKSIFSDIEAKWNWNEVDYTELFDYVFATENVGFCTNMAKTLSQSEVFESAIFNLIGDNQYYLCSPNGKVFKVDVDIFKQKMEYRFIKGWEFDSAGYFNDRSYWPLCVEDILKDVENSLNPLNENFSKIHYTTLNLFYDRNTYLIDCEEYRGLAPYSDVSLSDMGLDFKLHHIEPFEGYSVCIKEVDAIDLSCEIVRDEIFAIIFRTLFRIKLPNGYPTPESNQLARQGRPDKKKDAVTAFFKHFTIDDHPPWKEVVRILEEKEGITVSSRTIQRGLSDLYDDKNRAK